MVMALITRILVPTDFSEHAAQALAYAAAIAQKFDAPLDILHVYASPVIPVPDGYVIVSATELADLRGRLADGLDKEKARAATLGAGAVDTVLAEGTAWEQIVQTAKERGVDFIVMGTHGRTGLSHLILGSTAEKVVRKASCAVLTVGPRVKKQP
jgi:nucleotide-binding universal stress UspA family protein